MALAGTQPHVWSLGQRPGRHGEGEAQAHTYRLQPVLLPSALIRAVDEGPGGDFVVIQQADDDHDHHRDHHDNDDDLGKLQLRCEGRGKSPLATWPFVPSPFSEKRDHQAPVLSGTSRKNSFSPGLLLPEAISRP